MDSKYNTRFFKQSDITEDADGIAIDGERLPHLPMKEGRNSPRYAHVETAVVQDIDGEKYVAVTDGTRLFFADGDARWTEHPAPAISTELENFGEEWIKCYQVMDGDKCKFMLARTVRGLAGKPGEDLVQAILPDYNGIVTDIVSLTPASDGKYSVGVTYTDPATGSVKKYQSIIDAVGGLDDDGNPPVVKLCMVDE